jgi:RNA polymerase sigma factor (sigma-70 family)
MDVLLQNILSGCKQNDRACQKALYNRYFNLFMSMCMRYVNNRHDAEEALNNAFIRIFKHINKYNGKGAFEGWMKKIVVNCCLSFISKQGYINQSKIIPLQQDEAINNYDYTAIEIGMPDATIEAKYQQQHLLQLVQHLPETTRLVFNLYVFENYNHQEIAQLLSMAERTSQAHLAKARKILSAALDKKKLIHKIQRV